MIKKKYAIIYAILAATFYDLIGGLVLKEQIGNWIYFIFALILGFVAYGLSVFLYVVAQIYLGAQQQVRIMQLLHL